MTTTYGISSVTFGVRRLDAALNAHGMRPSRYAASESAVKPAHSKIAVNATSRSNWSEAITQVSSFPGRKGPWAGKFPVSNFAFSLVEVNLAILLVAVGLLTLFALFPLGLRESEMGIIDTHEAMFADHVLSGLEGNALAITNWGTWNDPALFRSEVKKEIYPVKSKSFLPDGSGNYVIAVTNVGGGVEFPNLDPPDSEAVIRYIRYKLTVSDNGVRKTAELMVKSGKYGDFDKKATVYFTEFVYLGM